MLSANERTRFATWLEMLAKDNEQLAAQIESLGPIHASVVIKYRKEAEAASLIAKRLRETH